MATVVSTIYPPLVETFMPAFPYEGPAEVTFSISPYNTATNIQRIHVSLVNQRTNQSAFINSQNVLTDEWKEDKWKLGGTSLYDNTWIVPFPTNSTVGEDETLLKYNASSRTCTLQIPRILLKDADSFDTGNYYKVQIRFDSTTNVKKIDSSSYLVENRQYFSEWSSVCLIKAVPNVLIVMTGFDKTRTNVLNKVEPEVRLVQPGLVPLSGKIWFSKDDHIMGEKYNETLREFSIEIYNASNELITSSETVFTQHNTDPNAIYWLADLTNVEPGEILTVKVNILTKNQYSTSKEYQMKIAELDTVTDFTPVWSFKKVKLDAFSDQADNVGVVPSEIVTEEDGIVEFNITTTKDLPQGYLYVKRATNLDDFKTWELISCTYNTGTVDKTIVDPTVGSLVKYRYSCQYVVKKSNSWTSTFFSPEFVYPKFYDILLSRQDKQLAIRYNGQITSYAPVVNRQVINTLGGKYPKFAENARMDYKKFSITGLITAESDFNRKFLNERKYAGAMQDYDINMDGKYELRNDTLSDGDLAYQNISRINYPDTYKRTRALASNTLHDVYPKDNWWLERKFREEALAWLNDGEPKLFRSMTEGNMIVILTDVSLTPNGQLGRRLYNFTCTAYEVGDGYSLDELDALGIIDVPDEYTDYMNGIDPNDFDDTDDGSIPRETVGQIYQKKAENTTSHTYLISKIHDAEDPDFEKYTVQDFYDLLFYKGALKKYQTISGFWGLSDLRIQFESPPQCYDLSSDTLTFVPIERDEEGNLEKSIPENVGLGYKVELTTYPNGKTKSIFVNERGYYQVPSNLIISEVALFDGAQATLDFKLKYRIAYDESSIPSSAERTDRIIGQVSGKWFPGQDIASEIFNKYEYYKYAEESNQGYEGIVEHQYLKNIGAFGWDGTTYAVFSIQFLDENKGTNYLVGRTGVYNIMRDFPIKNVVFKGRRMFKDDNEDYDSYKERTFLLDPSTATWNDSWFDIEADWKEKYKYDKEAPKEEVLNIPVVINGKLNNPILTKAIRKVQEWEDSTDEPYDNIAAVPHPSTNTIYGIRNGDDVVLKLYNFNKVWEDVNLAGFDGHGIIFVEEDIIKTGKKKNFREEWEFDLDESAITGLEQEDLTWYKVFLGKTDIPVIVNGSSDIYRYIRDIKQRKFKKEGKTITEVDIENVPVLDGYSSTEAVKNPEYNMVYRFVDGSYKIYYIDGGWYDIDFIEGTDNKIILAKVPVNGMVNYRGDIVKYVWG